MLISLWDMCMLALLQAVFSDPLPSSSILLSLIPPLPLFFSMFFDWSVSSCRLTNGHYLSYAKIHDTHSSQWLAAIAQDDFVYFQHSLVFKYIFVSHVMAPEISYRHVNRASENNLDLLFDTLHWQVHPVASQTERCLVACVSISKASVHAPVPHFDFAAHKALYYLRFNLC